ncbi:MAG TPA: hypothetical protein VLA83_02730 [Candidatus Binatia bacterium]|nr:hypothetical protein [Candidatus Binatia bacterium]
MKLMQKFSVLGLLTLCVTGIIGWTLFRPQSGPTHPLDQMMPEGALLYIEARDFSGLLKDWNGSPERAEWVKSDDYRVFSNSKLFLRLGQASDQFAVAAGMPPDMKFLVDAAGAESAVAIYNIGNLEFLYIARLSSGDFLQSTLWQSRNKFQPRTAGGKPFFARKDEQSGRVVAFAVADNYLILGTREDLVAGSLELMSGSKGRTLSQEGWYTQALAAGQAKAGDLRMVLNMEKIAVTPHFRTYWIQNNITEMQSYGSAISDLYREGATYREERVILPKKQADEAALNQSAQAVTGLLSAIPKDYGFYQAGPADAKSSLAVLEQKILTPRFGVARTEQLAPQVQVTGGQTGSATDLETRIDVEPASRTGLNAAEGLQLQLEKAGPQAIMVVQASSKNADGVLLRIPAVVAMAAASDWDVPSVRSAMQEMLAPGLTAARLGLQWREVKEAGGYDELDGLSPIQMAVRGKTLFVANDAGLLSSVLQTKNQPLSQSASYAAGFSHSRERQNFYKFSSLVDQRSITKGAEPQFFSQNTASFSRAFAKVDSEEIVTRQTKGRIQQTVKYRWMP